jgi:hypothetical protein
MLCHICCLTLPGGFRFRRCVILHRYARYEMTGSIFLRAGVTTVFQTWEWVLTRLEYFRSERSLLVLLFYSAEGRLVGIVPWSRSMNGPGLRCLYLLGRSSGRSVAEYFDAIIEPGFEEPVALALAAAVDRSSGSWDGAPLLDGRRRYRADA